MSTLTDESIPNLLINGGFEEATPDNYDPVCWTIRNARATSSIVLSADDSCPNNLSQVSSGESQANFWTRVTQPQRYPGYRTFLRLVVNSALTPLEAFYDLYDTRLASTIARSTPPLHDHFNYDTSARLPYFNQYRGAPGRAGKPNSGVDLDDRLVTIAMSYFVESGEGDIEVFAEVDNIGGDAPGIYEVGPDPLVSNTQQLLDRVFVTGATPTAEWKRIGKVFRFSADDAVQIFPGSGGAEIDLTGLMAAETVTFDAGGAVYGPITLTEGVDFSNAATLVTAINNHVTLGPLITARATGAVVQVTPDAGYTSDADLLAQHGTLADTVTGATWTKLNGGAVTTQYRADLVLSTDLLKGFTFRFTRTSESGTFVVYFSAVAMVHGSYTDPLGVPYNGDLSYLLDPRNIIRPTFGPLPPPGFRPLSDAIGNGHEFRFPVMGSTNPVPLQTGGEETHAHTLLGTKGTTSKKRLPGSGDAGARTGEHAARHEVTAALNAPPSRSAFLCIKL